MPDYRELYFKLFHETEKAINILIAAQRECEERYLTNPEPKIRILTPQMGSDQSTGKP